MPSAGCRARAGVGRLDKAVQARGPHGSRLPQAQLDALARVVAAAADQPPRDRQAFRAFTAVASVRGLVGGYLDLQAAADQSTGRRQQVRLGSGII